MTNAPCSAEATAVLTETRADGTTREYRLLTRDFRDAAGRVRVEPLIPDDAHASTAGRTLRPARCATSPG